MGLGLGIGLRLGLGLGLGLGLWLGLPLPPTQVLCFLLETDDQLLQAWGVRGRCRGRGRVTLTPIPNP